MSNKLFFIQKNLNSIQTPEHSSELSSFGQGNLPGYTLSFSDNSQNSRLFVGGNDQNPSSAYDQADPRYGQQNVHPFVTYTDSNGYPGQPPPYSPSTQDWHGYPPPALLQQAFPPNQAWISPPEYGQHNSYPATVYPSSSHYPEQPPADTTPFFQKTLQTAAPGPSTDKKLSTRHTKEQEKRVEMVEQYMSMSEPQREHFAKQQGNKEYLLKRHEKTCSDSITIINHLPNFNTYAETRDFLNKEIKKIQGPIYFLEILFLKKFHIDINHFLSQPDSANDNPLNDFATPPSYTKSSSAKNIDTLVPFVAQRKNLQN